VTTRPADHEASRLVKARGAVLLLCVACANPGARPRATPSAAPAPVAASTDLVPATAPTTTATAPASPPVAAPAPPAEPPSIWYCTLSPVESACANDRPACEDAHNRLSEASPCERTAEVFCTATRQGDSWDVDRCFAIEGECAGHRTGEQRCVRNP
jgi:hypothetical protein